MLEPLHRLEHGLADAAVEGDALGQLGGRGVVLEQEDVAERMAGAEHGLARGASPRRAISSPSALTSLIARDR